MAVGVSMEPLNLYEIEACTITDDPAASCAHLRLAKWCRREGNLTITASSGGYHYPNGREGAIYAGFSVSAAHRAFPPEA